MKKVLMFLFFVSSISITTFAKNEVVLKNSKALALPKIENEQMGNKSTKEKVGNLIGNFRYKKNLKGSINKEVKNNILFQEVCNFISSAADDSGNTYWLRLISFDCVTGRRIGAYDFIAMTYISYEDEPQ